MTEFINAIQPALINLGFVTLGYFFCKYRQKSKQAQSVANKVKQNESANNMKVDIKINPDKLTTTVLLSRLEKDNAYRCVYIIVFASFILEPGITKTILICVGVLLFLLTRGEQKKIVKELKNRHEDLSNQRLQSIADSGGSE